LFTLKGETILTTTLNTDIAIIGAGPTGLALASQLIRYGVDFVIVDKKDGTTPYSKAIGVQARTLEIYEQIGLAEPLIALGTKTTQVRLIEDGVARAEVPLTKLGAGMSEYPYLLIVEQGKHEKLLYDFIKANNKDVQWQTELEDFSQDDEGVTGTIVKAKRATQLHAKYLVACDGAKSPVRKALGINFEGSTFERLFYVADVQIKWEFPHDMLAACLAKDRSTAFFPMAGEDRYRIVGLFPADTDKIEGQVPYEEIEQQCLEDTKLEMDIYKVNWFSTYKVHSRRVDRFSEGRCFLVGDAAHIHSPAGAQGMNTGIQDGYNLAWKLATVLRGEADAKLLDTYNEERVVVAGRLLETTDRMFDLLMGDSRVMGFLRTEIFPYVANFVLGLDSVNKFVFPLISQIGISYRNRSLSVEGDGDFEVRAGERMPYFLIDGKSVYDGLHQPMFHMLTFLDGTNNVQSIRKEIEHNYAGLVDYHVLPLEPRAAEIFGAHKPFSVLLRPDNYIAFVCAENCMEALKSYFENVIGHYPVSSKQRAVSSQALSTASDI
jgi:2-polyprenyl-6-methoxyphenol hydroxylase-like FAD-dependent oxidoreductase